MRIPFMFCIIVRSSASSSSNTRCIHFIGGLLNGYILDASRLLFVMFAYEESFFYRWCCKTRVKTRSYA
ncbi:hypothetical protein CW755_16690 [Geobacillus thermodenitrificans]|nr:hypothetical protein CW755_16690 [Geobacillus thermodenitrificans]